MRRSTSAGLGLAMILGGCSADLPTDPTHDVLSAQTSVFGAQAHQHAAPPALPIHGTCELEIQPAQPVGPGIIRQLDVGTCRISHLGRSTLVSDKLINLVAGTQSADMAITAANGDLLYASGMGTNTLVAPGQVEFRVELTIAGGTGRFAGASGTVVSEGTADLANARSRLSMAGTIRY